MSQSKNEVVSAVRKILKAGQPLSPEETEKFWTTSMIGANHTWIPGNQVVELLALAPHNLDKHCNVHWAQAALTHIHDSKGSFEGVINNMPKHAVQNRNHYNIPLELARPLLKSLEDGRDYLWVILKDPELFDPSQDERLLKSISLESGRERLDAIVKLPQNVKLLTFLERKRTEVLGLICGSGYTERAIQCIPNLTNPEKLMIFKQALENIKFRTRKNGYYNDGAGSVQELYKTAKECLADAELQEFIVACKKRIDDFLTSQPTKDPIELFLSEEISWAEMVLAKTDPAVFEKMRSETALHHFHPMFRGLIGWPISS
jgi:hypothetical protein